MRISWYNALKIVSLNSFSLFNLVRLRCVWHSGDESYSLSFNCHDTKKFFFFRFQPNSLHLIANHGFKNAFEKAKQKNNNANRLCCHYMCVRKWAAYVCSLSHSYARKHRTLRFNLHMACEYLAKKKRTSQNHNVKFISFHLDRKQKDNWYVREWFARILLDVRIIWWDINLFASNKSPVGPITNRQTCHSSYMCKAWPKKNKKNEIGT